MPDEDLDKLLAEVDAFSEEFTGVINAARAERESAERLLAKMEGEAQQAEQEAFEDLTEAAHDYLGNPEGPGE